ncbi:MAG: iron ABC transporter permease, partial [Bacillota bacterium]
MALAHRWPRELEAGEPGVALGGGSRRGHGPARPPATVLVPAGLVVAAMVLPLVYLVLRTAGAAGQVWELLARPATWMIMGRSLALVAAVTAASVVVGVLAA